MDSAVNTFFKPLFPGKENSEVFNDSVAIETLRKAVVARLTIIEKEDAGISWWNDRELMNLFKEVYENGIIFLPSAPVDRLRWIAMLCIEMSNQEGFDCGNIILPIDFLPADMAMLFAFVYPENLMMIAMDLRSKLKNQGWKEVFGW